MFTQVLHDEVEFARRTFGLVGQCLRRSAGTQTGVVLYLLQGPLV